MKEHWAPAILQASRCFDEDSFLPPYPADGFYSETSFILLGMGGGATFFIEVFKNVLKVELLKQNPTNL